MTDVKQKLLDEATKEFEEKEKQIEAATDLFPVMNRFMEAYPDTYSWTYTKGANLYHWRVKKSKALQILDEIFWQNGLETSEPEIRAGSLTVIYEQEGLKLGVKFDLVQGDGCFKVPIGHTTVVETEWRCT